MVVKFRKKPHFPILGRVALHGSRGLTRNYRPDSDFDLRLLISTSTPSAIDEELEIHLQEVIEVTFTESEGRTTVSLNAVARAAEKAGPSDEAAAMLRGVDQGWAQTVDRLGTHLRR